MTRTLWLATSSANADAWERAFNEALTNFSVERWPHVTRDPDYLAVWKPPAEVFDHADTVRAIFNLGAGVDALLRLRQLPTVPVVRLEDAGMAAQMAQYVALAVLGAHRRSAEYAGQQRAQVWKPLDAAPAGAFTVSILGLGVLGRACAAALRPFGYRLLGWRRAGDAVPAVDETFVGDAGLPPLLAQTRVLVCLLPSTARTRNLLDACRLAALPRGAHLVNVARGEHVVEADLLRALDAGHLASATLDVFRDEPLPPGHPFWTHPRVTLTPHVSAVTRVEESVAQVARKIRQLERGEPISGIVAAERGY